ARLVAAGDLTIDLPDTENTDTLHDCAACDLLIVEDVQHLPTRTVAAFARLVDRRIAHGRPLAITANAGPAQLRALPPRLTSLLSTGLVIGLDLPSPKTRRYLLDRFAQR